MVVIEVRGRSRTEIARYRVIRLWVLCTVNQVCLVMNAMELASFLLQGKILYIILELMYVICCIVPVTSIS